jgi:hypothetical protein
MQCRGKMLATLVAFAGLAALGGCDRPIFNMSKLPRVRAEALALMRTHPVDPQASGRAIPRAEWPQAIASLNPQWVSVRHGSVDIETRTFFDGGWGYNVPRSERDLSMPKRCYSEPSEGVFWHGPC